VANFVRVKRRASGGVGAPSALKSAELAFNEVDNVLYYGKGISGAANPPDAATVEAIAGKGAVVMLTGDQTIDGVKTFGSSPLLPTPNVSDNSTKAATTAFVQAIATALGAGDMLKSVYDTTNNGVVDNTERLGGVLASAFALLASPAFSGTPTAPTPSGASNDTSIATTQFVRSLIAALSGAALGLATLDASSKVPAAQLPAYVDDILEFANLAAFPATGESGVIYVALDTNRTYRWSGTAYVAIAAGDVNTVFSRSGNIVAEAGDYNSAQITNNSSVSGLNVSAALDTLLTAISGLGSMSVQNSNAVAITGGTISGVDIDGGTF
jgi:Lower baseplate protein N-terminal domain